MVNDKINYNYCLIRVISCIGIVLLHLLNGALGLYGSSVSTYSSILIECVENLLLWCVPCFVMVTGALLLNTDKEITYTKLFKRYILRIIYALLFCCVIFTIFDFIAHNNPFTTTIIFKIFEDFICGKSWSHLWYLYLIIGIYLMTPVYRIITKYAKNKDIKYLLGLYFVFLSIIPSFSLININVAFYILVSTIYPFYLFYGYAFSKKIVYINKKYSLSLFLISSLALIILSSMDKLIFTDFTITFNYSFVLVVLQSIGIYSFINNYDIHENKMIKSIDSASFGIYLVHMIFVRLALKYFGINPFKGIPIIFLIIILLLVLLLSYIMIIFLKKIPVLRKFL